MICSLGKLNMSTAEIFKAKERVLRIMVDGFDGFRGESDLSIPYADVIPHLKLGLT